MRGLDELHVYASGTMPELSSRYFRMLVEQRETLDSVEKCHLRFLAWAYKMDFDDVV